MRFSSIRITNYRQYRALSLDFQRTCENDIHAIIASNGVGKTNLLNAINWCLYGKEPHMDVSDNNSLVAEDSEEDKLSLANVDVLQEAAEQGENTCAVTVEISATADNEILDINRSVDVNTKTYYIAGEDKFEIKVTKENGESEFLYGAEARNYLNKYLPEAIREYFFFDGEQLLKYFDVNKKKHIEATINSIAQIDSLNKAEEHLRKNIIPEFRRSLKNNDPQIEEKEKLLATCENDVAAKEKDISDLVSAIELSEQTIIEMDSIISGSETLVKDNDNYNANNKKQDELKEKKDKLLGELKTLIKEYTVLLMMYNANKVTYDYIENNINGKEDTVDIDIKAIKKTLASGHCIICNESVDDELKKKLENLVANYDKSGGSHLKLTEIKNDIHRALLKTREYKADKQRIFDELNVVEDEIENLNEENAELQSRIKKYSENSIEEVQLATQSKFEHEELAKRNREKLGSYKENLKILQDKKKQAEEAFNKAREANKDNEELNRKLNFAIRAQKICEGIINNIVFEVQKRMSEETKYLFEKLIWKKETYGKIELTSDYRLKIYHLRTGQSCLKSLSDAEKELLALAFTIALHKVSGYQNLLFIDTPVGRVSDENRTNFAKVLLDVSKNKQIILAFTPSEFKDEVEAVFKDEVLSSKYKLTSNEFEAKAVTY